MTDSDLPSDALQGTEILALLARFPNLDRQEITSAVRRCGPKRTAIEEELHRLSGQKARGSG
jgi:hypothetical protein